MFKNEKIKQIYEATDIVSLISETVTLKKEGALLFGLCPFHKESSPSFTVDESKRTFHCYGCGVGGNAYSFLMLRDGCSFVDAVAKLADRAGLPMPEIFTDNNFENKKSRVLQINELAYSFFFQKGKEDEQAKDYLINKRGLTEEIIEKFGLGKSSAFGKELYNHLKKLGFTNDEITETGLVGFGDVYDGKNERRPTYYDKFWDRIMFPIFDKDKNVVGFGGRILGDGKPKYLNSPETIVFDKSHELYGLHIARHKNNPFVLCEGYLDVISMHQAGFETAVASLGTSLTAAQAKIISEYTDTVFIAYDSDEAGIKATARAIPMLEDIGLRVFVVSTAPFKDVDALLKADEGGTALMRTRIHSSVPGKVFLARQFQKDKDYDNIVKLISC